MSSYSRASHFNVFANDLISRHHMIVMPVALVIWLQMGIKLKYPPTFCASFAECVVLIHSVVLSGDHDYVVCM